MIDLTLPPSETQKPSPNGDGRSVDPNPFDPERYRLRQDFVNTAKTRLQQVEIAVGKPGKQEWIRVHPRADYRLDVAIIEYDREAHLVSPELADGELRDQVKAVTLFTVQNTQGVTYLWPVSLPVEGRSNSWIDTARELAIRAMSETIKLVSNHAQKAQRYDAAVPLGRAPEPKWDELPPFEELLHLAFDKRTITTLDHPIAKRLLGIDFD
jgi:hypothetical protein